MWGARHGGTRDHEDLVHTSTVIRALGGLGDLLTLTSVVGSSLRRQYTLAPPDWNQFILDPDMNQGRSTPAIKSSFGENDAGIHILGSQVNISSEVSPVVGKMSASSS